MNPDFTLCVKVLIAYISHTKLHRAADDVKGTKSESMSVDDGSSIHSNGLSVANDSSDSKP
jgi:hypothetical protein